MNNRKVLLLHGLFWNGKFMFNIARRLKKLGYVTFSPSYPTVKQSVKQSAQNLEVVIRNFKGQDRLYFVGHSMGGILIRYLQDLFPDLFENSRVVTLGTPHRGSKFAKKIHEKWPTFVLGKAWHNSLDGNVPPWNPTIPLISIGGTKTNIQNWLVRAFSNKEINDGLVAISETEMEEIQAFKRIHQSHDMLCFNSEVVTWIDEWFHS